MSIVVLSNHDGCIVARSNEAKALGFEMGESYHLAEARIEAAGVFVSLLGHQLNRW